jgi:hypothetical protein
VFLQDAIQRAETAEENVTELRADIEELKRALKEQKPMQAINLRSELRGLEMVITDTQVNHTKHQP